MPSREGKTIGRWCRRYFGIKRRDERRLHFRFRQRLGQRADLLAQLFAKLSTMRVTHDDVKRLQQYEWSGNVRDLQNVIERAVSRSRLGSATGRHQGMMDGRP